LHENKKYITVFENKSKKERKVLISVMMANRWRLQATKLRFGATIVVPMHIAIS
jgi:hypothetical protein